MGYIALLLVGASVFLFLFGILVVKYSQFLLSRLVERKHLEAEHIIQVGSVPPGWCSRWTRVGILARWAKTRALARLSTIIRYFKATPMVDDEETREYVVSRLETTRRDWMEKNWAAMAERRY